MAKKKGAAPPPDHHQILHRAIMDLGAAAANFRRMTEASLPTKKAKSGLESMPKVVPAKAARRRKRSAKPTLIVPGGFDDDEEGAAPPVEVEPEADGFSQFRVEPSDQPRDRADGKRWAAKSPVKLGVQANVFHADPSECAAAARQDKKVFKKLKPSPRVRPKATATKVKVACDGCGNSYEAEPHEVNRKVTGDDEPMRNLCGRCIRNACG